MSTITSVCMCLIAANMFRDVWDRFPLLSRTLMMIFTLRYRNVNLTKTEGSKLYSLKCVVSAAVPAVPDVPGSAAASKKCGSQEACSSQHCC